MTVVSGVSKHLIVFTAHFTVYFCRYMLVNKQNKENYMYEFSSVVLRKRQPFAEEEKFACRKSSGVGPS